MTPAERVIAESRRLRRKAALLVARSRRERAQRAAEARALPRLATDDDPLPAPHSAPRPADDAASRRPPRP